jgi:hypothetical protein
MRDLLVVALVLSGLLNLGLTLTAIAFAVKYGDVRGELRGRRRHKHVPAPPIFPTAGNGR